MKKLIALALTLVAAHGAFAQGTVQFQNTALSVINTNDLQGHTGRLQSSLGFVASLYWGTDAASVTTLAGTETINPAANGVLSGSTLFAVNGAPAGSTAFFEVRVADTAGTWYGSSGILPFVLGAPAGPATVLFGSASTPNVFHSFTVSPVPEPSTIALAGLGAASLLLFRRRK